jgi:hypothetical protein
LVEISADNPPPAQRPPTTSDAFEASVDDIPAADGLTTPSDSLLFVSRFDERDLAGLKFDRRDVWSLAEGKLHALLPKVRQEKSLAFIGSENWTDYAVDLDLCGVRGVDKGVVVRVSGRHGIAVDLRGGSYGDVVIYRGHSMIAHAPAPNTNGLSYHLRIEAQGERFRVFVDGEHRIDCTEPSKSVSRGRVALAAYTGGNGECEVMFDHVMVSRLPEPAAVLTPPR